VVTDQGLPWHKQSSTITPLGVNFFEKTIVVTDLCDTLLLMKTITLKKAYNILDNAIAVMINDTALAHPTLWNLNGDPENQFMHLSSGNGKHSNMKFREGDNAQVKISAFSLFLYDIDADDETCTTKVTILFPKYLENLE
jgi:hypothetical protein